MFLSSYENKIDKRRFQCLQPLDLILMLWDTVVAYPLLICFRSMLQDRIEQLLNSIDSLNPFEDKRDYFATSILSESVSMQFDTEGRISLTEKLIKHANIKNSVLFVGLGKTFQIWDPKIFEKFKIQARKKAYQNRSSLKWENKQTKGDA